MTKAYVDPMTFLSDLMNNCSVDIKTRADAAKALMPFKHGRMAEGGKKQQRAADAGKVAEGGGRFSPRTPPRLVVNNR